MKTDLFQSCGHCWVFQICWHIECSTFTASSFRIWNRSTGIPSPPLALFIVMLSKAHLTSHSRMSGSRWVITPSWLQVVQFSSVQSLSGVHLFATHESQHAWPPCTSPTPRVHSDSCPSSQWCYPATSSSVVPFSFYPQSLPASEFFPMSQLFAWGGQSTGVSALASFLAKNSQGWSPSEWTGWISLQSKGLSRVFSNTTVQKHQFFGAQLVTIYLNSLYDASTTVQFSHSVVSDSLQPHGLQNIWLPCPLQTPGACSNSHPVIPSNHLILCCSLLLLPSIFPSIRGFSESVVRFRWQKYWSFSFSICLSNEYSGLGSFSIYWFDLQGTLKNGLQHHSSKTSIPWCSAFFMAQLYIDTWLLEKPYLWLYGHLLAK